MSEQPRGATAEDWFHFDFVLGLGSNLLPCVPAAPDVKVLKGSALEGKVGKIPSQFNRDGEAHGIVEWQKRPILGNEIQLWSADRRLNLCVRTGALSGVYAIDVDVEDDRALWVFQETARMIFPGYESPLYYRMRPNSRKILIPFRMEGVKCPKRKIYLQSDRKGPALELLADGQQFVASGSHSSGSRYQWSPALPTTLPKITLEQLNRLWMVLTSIAAPGTSRPDETRSSAPSTTATGSQSPTEGSPSATDSPRSEITDSEWGQLISALRSLVPHAGSNDLWSEIGYALLSIQHTRPARQLFIDFSRKAPGYSDGAPEKWWQDHYNQPTRTDYRHIFTLARGRGWQRTSSPDVFQPVPSVREAGKAPEVSQPVLPGEADAGLDVTPPPLPEKSLVRVTGDNFSSVVRQLESVIEPEVFTQGQHMVRLAEGHENAEIKRASDSVMLVEANPSWVKTRLGEICQFQRYAPKKDDWYNTNPESEFINALCNLRSWRKLRPLDAIARSPFVRVDGSICDDAGYDTGSRALLIPSAEYPRISDHPSRGDAEGALGRLRGVFDQFPWAERASESAFISHVFSEAGRLAIDRCPMFWYSAPSAGTGKGLLQEMASTIVHGNIPAIRPWVSDGDEIRKTLFASLLAGDRSLLFDNVPDGSKVRTPELCAFITADVWTDRKLGASEAPAVPNRAVISASGNNITPVSDLARRSVVIRLDANTERLAERRFKIEDLRAYVHANRAQMLTDVLTIIKAYHEIGPQPNMPVLLPSFERWSRLVREPIIWLGMPDPIVTQNETDDDTKSTSYAFTKLVSIYGTSEFSAVDITHTAGGVADSNGELAAVLAQAGCTEPNSAIKVGYWLRGVRDKICAGHKLVSGGHGMRGARWRFKNMNEDLT